MIVAGGSDQNAICIDHRIDLIDSQYAKALVKIARLYYERKDYVAAAKHYSLAAQLDSDRASHHHSAGCAYGKEKKYRLGIEHLKRALALEPRNLRYANNLATQYVDIGADAKAIETQFDAHQNPAHVHFNMAYLYSRRQRYREAMAHLDAALSHDPHFIRATRLRDWLSRR